jgi:tRNA pseudouridine13 synthase
MNWDPVEGAHPRYSGPGPALAWPQSPEDFQVEEIPLYPASGEGEHLFLFIEKRDLNTRELMDRVARTLNLDARELGHAGLKDRHAITRQWISLPAKAAEGKLDELGDENYRLVDSKRHGNKLKPGHLAGNRFDLFLAGEAEAAFMEARLAELRSGGLPNYFGPQRFGMRGDNHIQGKRLLEGSRKPKGGRAKLLANAWQSYLFNRVLAERVKDLAALLPGDLAWIHGKGAVFTVEDVAAESPRALNLEISPSGPLPGRKMSQPSAEAAELENRLLEECGWIPEQDRFLRGARRPLRVPVDGLAASHEEGGWRLKFALPPGSYATALLCELGMNAPSKE